MLLNVRGHGFEQGNFGGGCWAVRFVIISHNLSISPLTLHHQSHICLVIHSFVHSFFDIGWCFVSYTQRYTYLHYHNIHNLPVVTLGKKRDGVMDECISKHPCWFAFALNLQHPFKSLSFFLESLDSMCHHFLYKNWGIVIICCGIIDSSLLAYQKKKNNPIVNLLKLNWNTKNMGYEDRNMV